MILKVRQHYLRLWIPDAANVGAEYESLQPEPFSVFRPKMAKGSTKDLLCGPSIA